MAVQWFNQLLYFYQSQSLVESEVLRNRHLPIAANRLCILPNNQANKLIIKIKQLKFNFTKMTNQENENGKTGAIALVIGIFCTIIFLLFNEEIPEKTFGFFIFNLIFGGGAIIGLIAGIQLGISYITGSIPKSSTPKKSIQKFEDFSKEINYFPNNIKVGKIFNDLLSLSPNNFISRYKTNCVYHKIEEESPKQKKHIFVLKVDNTGATETILYVVTPTSLIVKYAATTANDFKYLLDFTKKCVEFIPYQNAGKLKVFTTVSSLFTKNSTEPAIIKFEEVSHNVFEVSLVIIVVK